MILKIYFFSKITLCILVVPLLKRTNTFILYHIASNISSPLLLLHLLCWLILVPQLTIAFGSLETLHIDDAIVLEPILHLLRYFTWVFIIVIRLLFVYYFIYIWTADSSKRPFVLLLQITVDNWYSFLRNLWYFNGRLMTFI